MAPDVLIKKVLAQREFWCELESGKRVRLRRPPETEIAGLAMRDAEGKFAGLSVRSEQVKRAAVGWEGFTEADLITSGASDVVEFGAELWAVLIEDRRDWMSKAAQALLDAILEHEQRTRETSGN